MGLMFGDPRSVDACGPINGDSAGGLANIGRLDSRVTEHCQGNQRELKTHR